MLQRAHYHHPPEYTVAHTNIGLASVEYRARVLILARAYVGSQPLEFTGYGSSLHRAINDAAYIAMAHMLHLHVELATQCPYHLARPLGEEVHLYLSAEHEPNHVLRNLAEYVRSSDRYHRVIGLELRQAHGRIAHLECLIEPYVCMGQIPRIELYGVEDIAAPAPAAAHRPAAAPTHASTPVPTPVAQEPMVVLALPANPVPRSAAPTRSTCMTAAEYRGLFKPVESESSRLVQRGRVIAPAPTWRSAADEEDYEPFVSASPEDGDIRELNQE
ncbi:hypothetical protein E2562_030637 [Oryza meyeriana var. granulata]|uniref:Uncharacterized protein n=1 Tax=Oryza meyeriana var. granulata TaxID=110450 RepID=A0A6G1C1L3_9ORYZ|nr:hypothetical protein E2562_030637 [Oryza meyeriana var. granulata]